MASGRTAIEIVSMIGAPVQDEPARLEVGKIIPTVLQTATIDLFADHNVAVAPLEVPANWPESEFDYAGSVQILFNPGTRAVLQFLVPGTLVRSLLKDQGGAYASVDYLKELTNQLAGRIKNRFVHYGLDGRSALPSAVESKTCEAPEGTIYRVVFRALPGRFTVRFGGDFSKVQLRYSLSDRAVTEGDIVLF